MLRIALMTALIGIVLLLPSGCERKSPTNETKDATPQAAAAPKHSLDAGNDHAGHEHGNGPGHSGQRHELGSRKIAGFTVEVVQFGAATDNVAELVFEIDVQGEPAPTAVRLLVRAPGGAESLKVKANKIGDHEYDAHVGELPNQLGEGSVLVVEVETPSGTKELMFPLKT
ncbi:MAG: hypothetical protein KAV82_00125 [Phycisphaerae bacterium]|nr:hypothetical protein [Phycisphaerae bacterium]